MSFFKKFFGKNEEENNANQNLFNNEEIETEETAEAIESSQEETEEIIEEAEEVIEEPQSETEEETVEEIEEIQPDEPEQSEEIQPEEQAETAESEPEEPKEGFFKKIFSGLDKTRRNILDNVENVLKGFTSIDDEMFEELEEVLIMADIGVETSVTIIEAVKDKVRKNKVTEVSAVKQLIVEEITDILKSDDSEFNLSSPSVVLVIGVNGVGKTTTIGKLAHNFKSEGKKVVLAAADTFRAAAIDQLEIWGQRNDVDVIKHQENSDPGAVVFDAIKAAKARKSDVLICDTAGRLHNKKNLMEELRKIYKIINREYSEAQLEVLLVLDATTGQNALQQAKLFKEVADLTGLVLTKLDGTAKGGVIIAIKNELQIPVRYIGVGEKIDDLRPFNAEEFAKALFGDE